VAVAMNIFDRFLLQHNRRMRNRFHNEEDEYEARDYSGSQHSYRHRHQGIRLVSSSSFSSSSSSSSTSSATTTHPLCHCPSCKRILDSRTYQLAAMTSLYLAIKLHTDCGSVTGTCGSSSATTSRGTASSTTATTNTKRTFKLSSFVELSRGQFVPADICAMEQTLLEVVQWQVHPPTPMLLASYMLATLLPSSCWTSAAEPTNSGIRRGRQTTTAPMRPVVVSKARSDLVLHVIRELSRYLTELAVCLGRERLGQSASHVAFCAILTAVELLTDDALPSHVRDAFYHRGCALLQLHPDHGPDLALRAALQKALWPELLFEDKQGRCGGVNEDGDSIMSSTSSSGHPIAMARDFGLLDMERVYNSTNHHLYSFHGASTSSSSPPDSPPRGVGSQSSSSLKATPGHGTSILQQCSPVSVTR
jgi:Cyclin, N-terminal domain